MPRKPIPFFPSDPYHISARCHNREWFELPLPTVWSIMEDYLHLVSHAYHFRIHAFVLMANHFHLLATAPEGNMSEALLYFMRETSREITRLTGRINQTYGQRNHKTRIGSFVHFMTVYKYVYQNPVRAKICQRAEQYPFSTLHGLVGHNRLGIPLAPDEILFTPKFNDDALKWLNERPDLERELEVQRALRGAELSFATCRSTGRPSPLQDSPL